MAYAMGGEKRGIRSAAPGEAFSAGELVAMDTDGLLYLANAALADRYPAAGLAEIAATAAMVTAGTLVAYVRECEYVTGAESLSPGQVCWAGEADGTVTTTRPSTHLDIAQAVGHAISDTVWVLHIDDSYEQVGITS